MKVGDLVRSRIAGWLALIVAVNETDPWRVDFVHVSDIWLGEHDSCSKSLFEVISEA